MAHEVLISYSNFDKLQADAICNRLESQGIRCWIAPRDVPVGTNYADSIVQAIEAAQVLVLVYSKHADESDQVKREVERAVSSSIHIMPVRIEDTEMSKSFEYYVGSIHWLDAITPPFEAHIDRLAHDLRALLTSPGPTPTPPRPTPDPKPVVPTPVPAPAPPPPPKRPWKAIGPVAGVVVIAALAYAYMAGKVVVQDVAGMPESEAVRVLEDQGVRPQVRLEMSSATAGGNAIGTEPGAGQQARRRSDVTLIVSGTVTVPQLAGRTEDEAKAMLAALSAGSHDFPSSGIVVEEEPGGEEGKVLRTSPEAGEQMLLGDKVTLYVAGAQVTVPDVTGQQVAAARAALEGAQVQPVLVADWALEGQAGAVLRTEPEAGLPVDRGSEVKFFVQGTGGWAYINDRSLKDGDVIKMPRSLNVRAEPRTGARDLGAVSRGAEVRVLAPPTGDGWVKIVRTQG